MFLSTFVRVLWRSKRGIALVILFAVLGGELLMRLPFIPQRLEYEPDPDFGGQLAPDQSGYMWLANISMQGPTIHLNRDGFRGADLDAGRPLVLVLGESEAFGAGVDDEDIWTRVLEDSLRTLPGLAELRVANAAHPGHGAEQEAIRLERILARRTPDALVVEVSLHQREFWLPPPDQRPREYEKAKVRDRVRRITKFLPYLLDKVTIQRDGIERAIEPFRASGHAGGGDSEAAARRFAERARPFWVRMRDTAVARGIPILFLLWYADDEPAARTVLAALEDVAREHAGVHVARLAPEAFGIDPAAPRARDTFRRIYTLQRDPHTNARFHRLAAGIVLRHITDSMLRDGREPADGPVATR